MEITHDYYGSKKVNNPGKLKAVAKVTIDDILAIHNIKVIDCDGNSNIITLSLRQISFNIFYRLW